MIMREVVAMERIENGECSMQEGQNNKIKC